MHDVGYLFSEEYAHRYGVALYVGDNREYTLQDRTDAGQNHEVLEAVGVHRRGGELAGNCVADERSQRQRQPVADAVADEHVAIADLAEREVVDAENHEQEAGDERHDDGEEDRRTAVESEAAAQPDRRALGFRVFQ